MLGKPFGTEYSLSKINAIDKKRTVMIEIVF